MESGSRSDILRLETSRIGFPGSSMRIVLGCSRVPSLLTGSGPRMGCLCVRGVGVCVRACVCGSICLWIAGGDSLDREGV